MEFRTENWNSYSIRFTNFNHEWLAVAQDVAKALDYSDAEHLTRRIPSKYRLTPKMGASSHAGKIILLKEIGIYQAVFGSHKPEAEQFKDWVYSVIQKLRQQAGLESYQAFEMLSKQVQKQAMERLDADGNVDYIKANQITNKAVANKYGLPKAINSRDMTPEMKKDRLVIVNDVTDLMNAKKRYGLDISVSKTIYNKVANKEND